MPSKLLDTINKRLLSRFEWFLAQYLYKGGCSQVGHWPVILYGFMFDRPRRSCFVPYLVGALQTEIFK